MSNYIVLPELGEGINEGTITNIVVGVGDQVEEGQTLLEVETDKVVLEVPAKNSGTVGELFISEGQSVSPGVRLLSLQEGVLADADKNKVIIETERRAELELDKPRPEELISETNAGAMEFEVEERRTDSPRSTIAAAPSARRLAREIGVDILQVEGSGLKGRITKSDVKTFAKQQRLHDSSESDVRTSVVDTVSMRTLPKLETFGPTKRETLSRVEQTTAHNMNHAWAQVPHAWLQEKIDITELEASRQKHKAQVKSGGGALTLTAIVVKAVARALQRYPRFNAALDSARNELVYRDYYHVGVAVDTPAGLVVPKVENANDKSLSDIALNLSELSTRARDRKLSAKDLSGAGFTISNLGGIGVSGIFPIVNWPQVAILGLATSQIEPRFIEGEFSPRLVMPLTLGFDHRVINGADGAHFLQYIKSLLEDPFRLLL